MPSKNMVKGVMDHSPWDFEALILHFTGNKLMSIKFLCNLHFSQILKIGYSNIARRKN